MMCDLRMLGGMHTMVQHWLNKCGGTERRAQGLSLVLVFLSFYLPCKAFVLSVRLYLPLLFHARLCADVCPFSLRV